MVAEDAVDGREPIDVEAVDAAIAESRRTMDRQIAAIERIGEKGDRTARFAVLVLGFTSSALAVGGPGALRSTHPLTAVTGFVGVVLLGIAAIAGTATTSQTDIPLGLGDSLRERSLAESELRWKANLLTMYDHWTGELESEATWNSRYLLRAQAALFFAMVCLLAGSGMSVLRHSYRVSHARQLAIAITAVFAFYGLWTGYRVLRGVLG